MDNIGKLVDVMESMRDRKEIKQILLEIREMLVQVKQQNSQMEQTLSRLSNQSSFFGTNATHLDVEPQTPTLAPLTVKAAHTKNQL